MRKTTPSVGKISGQARSDRLYRTAWFAIVTFLIGAMLSVTPLLWWVLPAEFIDTLASIGIVVVVSSVIVLAFIESMLWWETLW